MDLHVSSEARPDFPAETPEEPRDPCWHWRGNLMFWPQLQMRTSAPAMTVEESWEAPHNSYRDWTFLRPHEWVPEVPVVTREEPQVSNRNSRKTRRFSPSKQDEALFCCSISREIPPSLLSLEGVLYTLEATQQVPRVMHLHSIGTPSVPPQLKKSPLFPSSSREESPFPCFIRKGILAFPLHLKRRRSQLETREELERSCHNSVITPCPNPIHINMIPLH